MKILDLHLQAYGPFTDQRLDLSSGREGLHVVFGANEAGKSSALRALHALLYGVPERTRDDFQHRKSQLRVGGRLRDSRGEDIVCYRRKGRRDTLLDAQGHPIADADLSRMLGGADQRVFERLFGIDHDALVSGGESLLAERGREAEALFGSGLGSTTVHALLGQLDREARELFAPRASNPLINAALKELADIEAHSRAASLSARHWDDARRSLESAAQQLDELDRTLSRLSARLATLARIRRTLPALAKRTQLLGQLAQLGDVPLLAEDFEQRRARAVAERRAALERRVHAQARRRDLESRAAALEVSEELLAESERIDELRERRGVFLSATHDRPALNAERLAAHARARQLLAGLGCAADLGEAEVLRPLLMKRSRVLELGGHRQVLADAVRKGRIALKEAEQRRAAKQGQLDHVPQALPLEELRQAVEQARALGDLDTVIAETEQRFTAQDAACNRDLERLGLWRGTLAALLSASLPAVDTLSGFEDRFRHHADERRRQERAREQCLEELRRTEEALQALRLTGEVPSEPELAAARMHRDEGWRLVRRQYIDEDDVASDAERYAAGRPIADVYEDAAQAADRVADRLRREASRVHERAAAEARLTRCRTQLTECERVVQAVNEAEQETAQRWQELWREWDIAPRPPREMRTWCEGAAQLVDKATRTDELRGQLSRLRGGRQAQLDGLRRALAALGEGAGAPIDGEALTPGLQHAEATLRALEEAERRRLRLREELAELDDTMRSSRTALVSAEDEHGAWRAEWAQLMGELGLTEAATPGEASAYLQTLSDTLGHIDRAGELERRIETMDAETARFESDVRSMVEQLSPALSTAPVTEAVLRLETLLGEHKEIRTRREELHAQRRAAESDVQEADAVIEAAEAALAELCREAGGVAPEQLEVLEQRYGTHRRLSTELRELERELIEGGDGLGLEALEAEAGAVNRDAVLAEQTALEMQLEDALRPEREAALARKINLERDFQAMAGDDEASNLVQAGQQTLAHVRSLAQRYMRARFASRILRDEIEAFRRRHRDPILARAAAYFQRLTCSSMDGVETDFDDADQPVLVGVRSSGERLRVEAMSSGTRDQLYLALRLATLDHYLDSAEALPFIVDDILIQFDDERAAATLEALAEFSRRTQVVLFTHHGRDRAQALTLAERGAPIYVHALQ